MDSNRFCFYRCVASLSVWKGLTNFFFVPSCCWFSGFSSSMIESEKNKLKSDRFNGYRVLAHLDNNLKSAQTFSEYSKEALSS